MNIKNAFLKTFTGKHSNAAQIGVSRYNVFRQADKLNSQQKIKLDQKSMLFHWAGMF
ncbi:MAG: hypothetical protein OQK46_07635 [Gammaproteobacteria bacterium]|nr:hypothetical protein [Gammaproteobacteria bacterium]